MAEGLDRLLTPQQTCIYAANHASYLDAYALLALLPREVSFVAKIEFSGHWFTRMPLKRLGTLFVERFETERSIADARDVIRAAASGRSLMFFPEGTFTRVPGVTPFYMGAFVTAAEAGVPVVPVAIRGTRSILRDDSWFPRRGTISIVIGEPIIPEAGDRWTSAGLLREETRRHILRHCGEPDLAA